MKYQKIVLTTSDDDLQKLIAELASAGIDQFQQLKHALIIYLACDKTLEKRRASIHKLLKLLPKATIESEKVVKDQNWNETWEQTIKPQTIGSFLVKPTWSDVQAMSHQKVILIDPKMAFGTGYHETTRLMLQQLPEIIKPGDQVLDAGTGTGILAIASVKLGAKRVTAFDHDERSIVNARENIVFNECEHQIRLKHGNHHIIKHHKKYDVILANIQVNIIKEMMPTFARFIKKGGKILVSGVLKKDQDKVCNVMIDNKISSDKIIQMNNWISIEGNK